MTCCAICKITRKESIEESDCGCPEITISKDGSAIVYVRGYIFSLEDYLIKRKTANKDAVAIHQAKIILGDKKQ